MPFGSCSTTLCTRLDSVKAEARGVLLEYAMSSMFSRHSDVLFQLFYLSDLQTAESIPVCAYPMHSVIVSFDDRLIEIFNLPADFEIRPSSRIHWEYYKAAAVTEKIVRISPERSKARILCVEIET